MTIPGTVLVRELARSYVVRDIHRTADIFGYEVPADDACYAYAYVMSDSSVRAVCTEEQAVGGCTCSHPCRWWDHVTYVGYTTNARKRARDHFLSNPEWAVEVMEVRYSPPVGPARARKLERLWASAIGKATSRDPFWLASDFYKDRWVAQGNNSWVDCVRRENLRFWFSNGAGGNSKLRRFLSDYDAFETALASYELSPTYLEKFSLACAGWFEL